MSKGGSPMGSGGFGGQQQQGGFGGGFGGQRFNQMPQQQQQGGFGGGFGGQQGSFGNTFARTMPPQQGGVGSFDPGGIRSTPVRPPRQQGFGSSLGSFLGGQGFNMPQQRQQDMFTPQIGRRGPQQEDFDRFEAQNAAMRSMGMPAYDANTDPLRGAGINIAQPPQQPPIPPLLQQDPGGFPLERARFNAASQPGGNLLGGAFGGGGSQPVLGTPGGNLVGGMDPRMLRPNVNRSLSQPQMPSNPYAQQMRQEDPRMQAMRNMQRMRFGGGGGYNF